MKRIISLITILTVLLSMTVFPQVSYANEEEISEISEEVAIAQEAETSDELSVYYYEDFKTGYEEGETKIKTISGSGLNRVLHNGEYVMQVSTPGGYTAVSFSKVLNIPEKSRVVLEYQVQANMVGGSNNIGFLGQYGMPTCYIYGSNVKLKSYQDKDNIGSASFPAGVTITVVFNNEKAERDIYVDGKFLGTFDSTGNTFYDKYLESGELNLHFYNYIQSSSSLFYKYIKVYEAPKDYSPETFMPNLYKNLGKENVFVATGDEIEADYFGLIKALGLWNAEDLGEYNPSEKLTRLQFAGVMSKILKVQPIKSPKGIYKDIARRHFMAGTLEALNQLDIMKGVAADSFAPELGMKAYDAATALTRALGYETFAQYKGGYVTGFVDIAKKVGILKGVDTSGNPELTQKDAVRMIYNFLNTEVFQMKTIDADGMMSMEAIEGDTVLSVYHDVDGIKGIMSANDETSLLSGDDGDETAVVIGEETLKFTDKAVNNYIGYQVEAYYDAETNWLIYCFVTDKNKTLAISAEDFDEYKDGEINYYDGNTLKHVNLSMSTDAIFNGKAAAMGKSLFDGFNAGQIKLIDNTGDGEYDVVIVQSYVNRIVDNKITDGDVITFKNNKGAMFLEKDYKSYKFMDANGKEIAFSDVAPGSIVSVMESKDKTYVTFYVSTNSIVGELEGMSKTAETVNIAGKKYNVSADFFTDFPGLSTGIIGEFFMDVFGNIAAYSEYDTFGKGLAYLISIDANKGLQDNLRIKVYTDENKLAIFETNDKLKLNGASVPATSLLSNAEITDIETGDTLGQLVAYELSDAGKIVALDTKTFDEKAEDENNTIHFIAEGNLKYNSIDKRFGTYYLNTGFSTFEIPEDANSAEADDFAFGVGSFADESSANTMLYKLSNNTLGADVIVTIEKEGTASFNSYSRACLVSEIEDVWDAEEEEEVKLIRYWQSGSQHSVKVVDEALIKGIELKAATETEEAVIADITPGDIIIMATNSKKELKAVKLLVDFENPTAKAAGNRGTIHRGVYGIPYEVKGDLLYLTTTDVSQLTDDALPTDAELHRISTVYVYDSERKLVSLGSKSDLIDFKTAGKDASKIVFYETKGYDYDLIIYR